MGMAGAWRGGPIRTRTVCLADKSVEDLLPTQWVKKDKYLREKYSSQDGDHDDDDGNDDNHRVTCLHAANKEADQQQIVMMKLPHTDKVNDGESAKGRGTK